MAWPTDRTETLTNASATVWRELLPYIPNLITENEDKLWRVVAARGAMELYTGGDAFDVNVRINGGMTSTRLDPSAADPTTSLGTTAYQILAPSTYRIYETTRNIYWNQSLQRLTSSPRRLMDIFREQYVGNMMEMLEEMVNDQAAPGGFFNPSGVLPNAGVTNAKAMVATTNNSFAGVLESSYSFWNPVITNASNSAGANLLTTDLQKFINDHRRGTEGGITDIFTSQTVWEKIRSLYVGSAPILAVTDIAADIGLGDTIQFGGVLIHWSRFLASKSTAWDVTGGATSEYACLGFDFHNIGLRYGSAGESLPGDEMNLFQRLNQPILHATLPKFYQRVSAYTQWFFKNSRRTSGQLEGLSNL